MRGFCWISRPRRSLGDLRAHGQRDPLIEYKAEAFDCPCHGSRFDAQGRVNKGPAVEPLPRLRVEQGDDGALVVLKD